MNGKSMLMREYNGRPESSVILFDCEKIKGKIPPLKSLKELPNVTYSMNQIIPSLTGFFDPRWNCMDGETRKIEDIWHLHYTRMSSQPWKPKWFKSSPQPHHRPEIAALWHKLHEDALAAGYKAPDYTPFGKYNIIGR